MGISTPASSAASTIPRPGGTWTSRPSIVTVTSSGALNPQPPSRGSDPKYAGNLSLSGSTLEWSPRAPADLQGRSNSVAWHVPGTKYSVLYSRRRLCRRVMAMLLDRREGSLQRRLAAVWAPALVDVALELVAEALHVLDDRPRGEVAERAQALAQDPVADREQEVELGLLGAPFLELLEQLHHPARPLPAGRALAARLVHVELGRAERQLHHAGAVVDHDHRRRSELRSRLRDRVEVEIRVELVRRHHRGRRAAGDDRLQLPSLGDAASDVVDQLPQGRTELELVVAGPLDVSGQGEDDGSGRGLGPDLRVPLAAVLDDGRDGRHGLDVVDQRGRAVQAADRGERRPGPRLAAMSLQRLEQGRLLAADVCPRTAMEHDRDLGEQIGAPRLFERRAHHLEHVEVLAAQIDEDVLRLDSVGRDQAA